MNDQPSWVGDWCRRELDAAPVEQMLAADVMSDVRAVRLDDGRVVVLKARLAADAERAGRCVAVQRQIAEKAFPCARPLTGVSVVEHLAVHAEEWRPGGEIERDTGPGAAVRSARLLAALMALLDGIEAEPPLPSPEWVNWGHDGPGLFPPNPRHDPLAARVTLPAVIDDTARRARARLLGTTLPRVVGHADWEAQNLRWDGREPHTVHDWDSLAWLPEAALVGAAAGAFASAETPTLASLESSEAFLAAYQRARRPFDAEELEVAWAASLWPALHNGRAEILYDQPHVAFAQLEQQAAERLARASA
ncbi:MAG TPA: phosphotransferase [Gaiellaceae bacterium]|nr:phosphotransferase [Gaiellaceae bacterium]